MCQVWFDGRDGRDGQDVVGNRESIRTHTSQEMMRVSSSSERQNRAYIPVAMDTEPQLDMKHRGSAFLDVNGWSLRKAGDALSAVFAASVDDDSVL